MRIARPLTVLALASLPLGCPDDSTPSDGESSSTSSGDPDGTATTTATTSATTTATTTSADTTDGTTTTSATDTTAASTESSSEGSSGTSESTGSSDSGESSSESTAGSESSTGGPLCPEDDLGSAVPVTVDVDTSAADDSFQPACANMGGLDVAVSWTPPADGTYYFTTSRDLTAFDTTLVVLDGSCDGGVLACDDDAGDGTSSFVVLDLVGGQTVVVVVDGFDDLESGSAQLHIDAVPGPAAGGNCCSAQPGVGGCDTPAFEQCVCGFAEDCCAVQWSDDCASAAIDVCNAECGPTPQCLDDAPECTTAPGDCVCLGCNDNGVCGADDDCVCADCAIDPFCSNPLNCVADGACDVLNEGCVCADCADEAFCAGGPTDGCTEDPGDGCSDPPDDCACVGCNTDATCDDEDDCVCPDCTNEAFCGGLACIDDGLCDVFDEGCSCADCADEPPCAGMGGTCDPLEVTADIDGSEPTYNRAAGTPGPGCALSGVGTDTSYDVHEYTLTGAGPHDVTASTCNQAAFDSFVYVYQDGAGGPNPFDPDDPCTNLVALSDDAIGCGATSEATVATLVPGTVQIVVTTFANGETGGYTLEVASTTCQSPG